MMRFLLVVLSAVLLSPAGAMFAQESVDIEALSERMAGIDTERLLMRLNTPIAADMLPDEFSEPRPMDPESLSQQRVTFGEAFESISGSAVYSIAYMPRPSSATPEGATTTPQSSPFARPSQPLYASSTLAYLLLTDPIDTSDQDAFAAMVQRSMGSEAESGTVEHITVGNVPAVLITSDATVNAIEVRTQWIAVPVGKVVMVAMVLSSTETYGEEALLEDNMALALAGLEYLDAVTNE